LALREDLAGIGDLTCQALLLPEAVGQAALMARANGTIAGLPAAQIVYRLLDPSIQVELLCKDGDQVESDTQIGVVSGPLRAILSGERTALNFLQRLSGVATQTRRFVEAIAGLPCQILDTRKTTPGWRRLEKYAVRCGGGRNHRMGLYDAVLIKDNQLAALGGGANVVPAAFTRARLAVGRVIPIEIEVEQLEQLDRALPLGPDRILLDNVDLETLQEAVRRRNSVAPKVQLEASGGVTLATVRAIAETGVDFISVGALTHSAPALDIALDFQLQGTAV
jgi:nicotinate-nucleotide pyrophosphorylase (carboxylating)